METVTLGDIARLLIVISLIGFVSAVGPWAWKQAPRLGRSLASLFNSIMSISLVPPPIRTGSDGGSERFAAPVLGQQNQAKPSELGGREPLIQFSTLQNMDDADLIALLAVLRLPNGDYRFSANKIRDIVGGSDTAVKAQVAAHRPKEVKPSPPRSIGRPPNGWVA